MSEEITKKGNKKTGNGEETVKGGVEGGTRGK